MHVMHFGDQNLKTIKVRIFIMRTFGSGHNILKSPNLQKYFTSFLCTLGQRTHRRPRRENPQLDRDDLREAVLIWQSSDIQAV